MSQTETKQSMAVRIDDSKGIDVLASDAELIAKSLKSISRDARVPERPWARMFVDSRGRPLQPFFIGLILSFIGTVIVPAFVCGLYLAFFTTNQYASEARFAVRGGTVQGIDPIASLTGSAPTVRLQDSAVVAEFIKGRSMVEMLDRSLQLRDKFSGPNIDYIFGFNAARSIERLVNYWWWQVDVNVERTSGIITLEVRAFTPQDALDIARFVVGASERLVNDLSERSRNDALKQARQEVVVAERLLQEKIKAMRELRERQSLLDPKLASEGLTKVIGEVRLELSRLESEYSAQRGTLSESAPQLRVLQSRIQAAREQIKKLEAMLTSSSKEDQTLAEAFTLFDKLKLEQELAQKYYIAAATVLERTRIETETQQLYLATFVQPVLAEEPLYPKRWYIFAVVVAVSLLLWGAGAGIAYLIRNHAA